MATSNRSASGEFDVYTAEDVNDVLAGVVRRAAEPTIAGELISQQVDRASRRLRMRRGFIKRLWYRELRTVPAHVAMTLLAYDRRAALLHDELADLRARLDALRDS